MAITGTFQRTFQVGGQTFSQTSQPSSDMAPVWSVDIPAAKTGTLTTRSSDTAGTLTMSSGHGITTGAMLHVFWTVGGVYGSCRVTVGTVSVNSVPFTSGVGDALPVNNTAITAMVPTTETLAVPGDNLVALATKCPVGGYVVFADGSNTELYVSTRTPTNTTEVVIVADGTNPLSGDTVAKLFLSHPSSTAASTVSGAVMYD